jgi:aspartyl protease family protein
MRLWMCCLLLLSGSLAASEINLVGLLGEKALVEVDGSRAQLVAVGQRIGQARLLAISSGAAQFEINGRKVSLTLDNRRIQSAPTDDARLTLSIGESGHFLAHLRVNKLPLLGIIDTGASVLALSSIHARMAGINPDEGVAGRAHTAQGWVDTRRIKVRQLQLGRFTLHDIDAVIVEGEFPLQPLIGMNVLQRFSMQREAELLILTPRY